MPKNANGDPILNTSAGLLQDGDQSLELSASSLLPRGLSPHRSQQSLHLQKRAAQDGGEYGMLRRDNEASWSQPRLDSTYQVYPEQQLLFNGHYIFERQSSLDESQLTKQITESRSVTNVDDQSYLMTLNNNKTSQHLFAGQSSHTLHSFASQNSDKKGERLNQQRQAAAPITTLGARDFITDQPVFYAQKQTPFLISAYPDDSFSNKSTTSKRRQSRNSSQPRGLAGQEQLVFHSLDSQEVERPSLQSSFDEG